MRSESASTKIPQRPAYDPVYDKGTVEDDGFEMSGSYKDGPGTYRSDPAHGPGKVPYKKHNEYDHLNIKLRDGTKREVVVTGVRNF